MVFFNALNNKTIKSFETLRYSNGTIITTTDNVRYFFGDSRDSYGDAVMEIIDEKRYWDIKIADVEDDPPERTDWGFLA